MLYPKLRFSEFTETWEKRFIKQILTIGSGRDYKHLKHGEIPVFGTGGLMSKVDDFLHEGETVCIGRKGTIDKPMYFNGKIWTVDTLFYTHSFNHSNPLFVYYIFNTINWKEYNEASGVPSLSKSTIEKIIVNIPSLPEQQKIASFLSTVDQKINLFKKQLSLLEQYKKVSMQKIFSREIRFKDEDGNEFPEWEERRLNEVVKIYDGTHQTPIYVDEGIPFYSVEHVTSNQFTKTKYISREVFEKENKRVKLERGDILMTRIGSIGVAKLINWEVEGSFYVSLALLKNNNAISNEYLAHFIHSRFFQNELWKRTIHVAFPQKINLGEIGECIVKLPSLSEQQKIASFLSTIDEKIDYKKDQIRKMESWKKGLLQQMLI